MTQQEFEHYPLNLNLLQRNRVLEVEFEDGQQFSLPCEYLRVYSPSAENKTLKAQETVITGKEQVNITAINPVGSYAVQLVFDDGHDSGVYSWKTLYELGQRKEANWQAYLDTLARIGYERVPEEKRAKQLRLLYFAQFAKLFLRKQEKVVVPSSISNVKELLDWLRQRGGNWQQALREGGATITINRQFATPETVLRDGDEIGLVPTQPEDE